MLYTKKFIQNFKTLFSSKCSARVRQKVEGKFNELFESWLLIVGMSLSQSVLHRVHLSVMPLLQQYKSNPEKKINPISGFKNCNTIFCPLRLQQFMKQYEISSL